MNRPTFVDAHAHLWELERLRYPWLTPPFPADDLNGTVAAIASDYPLDAYLAEASGWDVRAMVHIQAGADPVDALAETIWLQATADARGMPNAIVAAAVLDDPSLEQALGAHAAHPHVRGVRHIVNWHRDARRTYTPRDVTQDDAWRAGFGRLADHGLSFDLQAYPGQFPALATLFERHPDIPVAINHAGMGIDGNDDWYAGIAPLARLPHVFIKLSGFGFAFRPLDPQHVRDRVRAAIDLFGTERAMMASDFPTDRLFASFDDTLDMLLNAVCDLTPDEIAALFANNASGFYRLGLELSS